MNIYLSKTKSNLENAKSELNNVLNILEECIKVDSNIFQKTKIDKVKKDCSSQINNLTNYIIPADRESETI